MISDTMMNTFRYGHTKIDEANVGQVNSNLVSFRFIDDIIPFTYNESRTTPTHNFVNELSWLKGDHNFKFGANIRFTRIPSLRENSSWLDTSINPSWARPAWPERISSSRRRAFRTISLIRSVWSRPVRPPFV